MHTIRTADGHEYRCADDDTLLRAGLRAGLGFPYECNAGSCGTCKVELISGQVVSMRPDAPGLTDQDRARNRILACQARPSTDCQIKARLRSENVPRHRPARFRAKLMGHRDLTHDMREFTFTAPGAPGFRPGQYALFYLPGIEAPRTYSMSNIDDGSGTWQFIVRRVPGGHGTVALFDKVPIASHVELDGPYGLAYLREESPRDLILIGGGSGLAPVLSLARGVVHTPGLDGRAIHIFYGARSNATCAPRASSRRCRDGARASRSLRCFPSLRRIRAWRGMARRVSCTTRRGVSSASGGTTSSTTSRDPLPWRSPCSAC